MIGRTNAGGGSGGGGIELTILPRLTRPERPSVNTLWVETAEQVTDYIFSAVEPESPENGLLWITLTNEGTSEVISPVDKEWVVMRVSGAKLRVNGEWVFLASYIYRDGAWRSFTDSESGYFLFKDGEQYSDITGGWASFPYSAGSGYSPQTLSIDTSNNGLSITMSGSPRSSFIGTNNKIDLTDYTTLEMEFSEALCSVSGGGALQVTIYSDKGHTKAATGDIIATNGTVTLSRSIDVSSLNGEYYVGFFVWIWNNSCTIDATMISAKLS